MSRDGIELPGQKDLFKISFNLSIKITVINVPRYINPTTRRTLCFHKSVKVSNDLELIMKCKTYTRPSMSIDWTFDLDNVEFLCFSANLFNVKVEV
jgi:hypothetical protein